MKKLIFLWVLFWIGTLSGWAQIVFKGAAPRAVVAGEQFRVNYVLSTNGEKGKDIRLTEVAGLNVLYGPTLSGQSTSTSIINGNVSSQVNLTYTYILLGDKEGEYTIPPATITVGNSEYKSNELKIKVLPPDQASAAASANQQQQQQAAQQRENQSSAAQGISGNDLFVRMNISKSSVYENEGFLVTFKMYTVLDVEGFDNVKFPEFEGFIAQDIDLPANTPVNIENYQGRNYRTIVIKQTVLYPQRSGKITINQGKFDVIVRSRVQSQRSRSFFDDYFDTYTKVKKSVFSQPATIDVKPLPTGKPTSFSGGVGDYKITSSISTKELKTNESVTVKISISGNGNIKLIKNPEVVFPNDFEVYDPKVDVNTRVNQGGVSGTKTIEYYAVPRYAGTFTIPKVEFSYFDLKSGTYKTLYTDEYRLQVAQGAGGEASPPMILQGSNKEDVRFVGKDIRYIKTDGFNFQKGNFLFGTLRYGLYYLIPGLLFIVFFIIYRKQARESANLALMRTRKANKVASKRLKKAQQYLKENQRESFYDEMLKAIWGYLSDKLNIPVSNLTKDNVEMELTRYGANEELISQFRDILNTAEFARFAPSQAHEAMDELYNRTVNVINKMESTIK
ncbi:MAG: BatD family protein [Candidatus Azobacteroides sp.]|nr:BatD family protein [Candidatus Azobacteroides sp.]